MEHLSRAALHAYRSHSSQQHLRVHHAIYLNRLLEDGDQWSYDHLAQGMRSTLNRFLELVDRVALTRCNLDSWREGADVSRVIKAGEDWIETLIGEGRPLLKLENEWGSSQTRHYWNKLANSIAPSLKPGIKTFEYRGNTGPYPYEIFSGGFEYVPTVGTFPFYLFGERLSTWTILKYAQLKALALITNTKTLRRVEGDLPAPLPSVEWEGSSHVYSLPPAGFQHLMRRANDLNIRPYYLGAGHAAVTLASQLVDAGEYWTVRSAISPIGAGGSNDIARILAKDAEGKDPQPAVVLTDLGDASLAAYLGEGERNDDKRVIIVDGLNVPVGLGFSLAALPQLLRNRAAVERLAGTIREWCGSLPDKDRQLLRKYDGIEIADAAEIESPWTSGAPHSNAAAA